MPAYTTKLLVWIGLYCLTGLMIVSFFIWTPADVGVFPIWRNCIIFFASVLLAKYFIYMTLSPWYDVVKHVNLHSGGLGAVVPYVPRVSVIVPAWNEAVGLPETVRSILASEYRNIEIVVVNDGSTDESDALMRRLVTKHRRAAKNDRKIALKYFFKENGGKGRALNYGIERASGDIIITLDADCTLTPGTIGNFVRPFADPKIMAAVGNVKIGDMSTILGTLQYLEFLFSFYFKKADSLMNTIYIIGGAAGAFRREVFERVGSFDSRNITEDIDLSVRIQAAGMRIAYVDDAVVYTEGASTFAGLKQQRLRWKYGRFQTFFTHRSLFFSAQAGHNRLLTWIVLPLAIFGEVQLSFEPVFLGFLYIYSVFSHNFSSFLSGIIVVSAMFAVQLFDDRASTKRSLYVLAPVGWLLFYITTFVEHRALFKSLSMLYSKEELAWQKWKRVGCFASAATGTVHG